MGKKKIILKEAKCGCDDSSSSCSSSSSSCSSSSNSQCCNDESSTSECIDPRRFKNERICPREVKTLSLQTCNISYRKRVLEVGAGCKYPTLDCALEKVRPNKGGYIIKLRAGIHHMVQDCCLCVDDLTIVGDSDNPFAGFFYMQGGNHNTTSDFEVCQELCPYDKNLGEGPFEITASNRRFTVRGNISPNFDCLLQDRVIGIVHTDGSVTQARIIRACGNTITVDADVGFGDTAVAGEGFFFYPNVIISAGVENIHITTTGRLTFIGVVFDGSNFTLGSSGDILVINNSIGDIKPHLHITGQYNFLCPNTFLGTIFLAPASRGSAFYQSVVGRPANLLIDSSGFHSWKFCSFCSCLNAVKTINSSMVNFKGSQFINNYEALLSNGNCSITIYSTYFYGNTFAVLGFNRSFISSTRSDNSPQTNYVPVFRENRLVFLLNMFTTIMVPNATIENNTYYTVIDTVILPTIESNLMGQQGNEYSILIDPLNLGNAQNTKGVLDAVDTILGLGGEAIAAVNPSPNAFANISNALSGGGIAMQGPIAALTNLTNRLL